MPNHFYLFLKDQTIFIQFFFIKNVIRKWLSDNFFFCHFWLYLFFVIKCNAFCKIQELKINLLGTAMPLEFRRDTLF